MLAHHTVVLRKLNRFMAVQCTVRKFVEPLHYAETLR